LCTTFSGASTPLRRASWFAIEIAMW